MGQGGRPVPAGGWPVRQVLVKVYAGIFPADERCRQTVEQAGRDALGQEDGPWLFIEGDMLRIAFEGYYFPLDDVLEALEGTLKPGAAGKLDYLDFEAWTLTRCEPVPGREGCGVAFSRATRSLNQVLEYSGH